MISFQRARIRSSSLLFLAYIFSGALFGQNANNVVVISDTATKTAGGTSQLADRVTLVDGSAICDADPSGDRRLVFFPGRFDGQMDYVADPAEFSISCVSGVQAKCLRWGYRPWANAPEGGASLAPYYNTCIRTARADYCGDDQPTTRNGTTIDLYDRVGVQKSESDPLEFPFEAGWSPTGAVCVHHPRIKANATLAGIAQSCPRLREAPLGEACDEAGAAALGALLFNRSRQ